MQSRTCLPVQTLNLSKTEEGGKTVREVGEGDKEARQGRRRDRMNDEMRITAEQEDGRM